MVWYGGNEKPECSHDLIHSSLSVHGIASEPIMLLILPIFLSKISHNFHPLASYSLIIPMVAITYYSILFLKFDCVTCKNCIILWHLINEYILVWMIKMDSIINSSYFFLRSYIVAFIFIISLIFDIFHNIHQF